MFLSCWTWWRFSEVRIPQKDLGVRVCWFEQKCSPGNRDGWRLGIPSGEILCAVRASSGSLRGAVSDALRGGQAWDKALPNGELEGNYELVYYLKGAYFKGRPGGLSLRSSLEFQVWITNPRGSHRTKKL